MADGLLNKASIILTPTGYKAGTLYNVAPIDEPYEDFDFARASVASRVNSSGLVEMVGRTLGNELVTNGNFSNGLNNWTTNTATESGGVVTIPNNGYIFQTINFPDSGTIKIQVEGSGTVKYRLGVTSPSNTFITKTLPFTAYEDLNSTDVRIQLNNTSGSDITVTSVSVKEIIDTNNIPRISYDSNGDNGHILLEPTSTNLVPYSENFSDSSWTKSELTESLSNINSPDGTQNAYKLTESNSSSKHQIFRSIASYTELTISFFAKKAERSFISVEKSSWGTTVFNLNDGSVVSGNGSVVDFGNGWYRCSASYTASPAQSQFYILLMQDGTTTNYQGDGTSGLYLFGVQAEELSYATSYIPTLMGSTETRATETATGAGSADLINSTEGVLYAEIARAENDTNAGIISLNDGSNSNLVSIYYFSNNKIAFDILSSSPPLSLSVTTSNTSNFNKIALKYKSGDIALWVNGVEVITRTETISLSGLNNLDFRYGGTTQPFYGKVKSVAVFDEALSDSELTQLTT